MKSKLVTSKYLYLLFIFTCTVYASFGQSEECTIGVALGSATDDGRPLLWKTRDFSSSPDNEVKYNTSFPYTFISVAKAGSSTLSWMGVNEHGFSIVNSASIDLPTTFFGPGNGSFMRDVLGHCKTVDEFQDYLDSTNATGRSTQANFAVIDATGAAAIFETGGKVYYKFDAADSPNGYIVRTNFSINGGGSDGIERYDRSNVLINNFFTGDSLGYKSIIRHQMRDFSDDNSNPVSVPYPGNWASGSPYGYIHCSKSICRTSSVSAAVIHGVLPSEFAGLTTMWAILGQPASTIALPYWPVGNTPAEADGASTSELCDVSLEIRSLLFDYSDNKHYIDSYKLRDGNGEGLWPCIFPVEDYVFLETKKYMDSLRSLNALPVSSMLNKEADFTKYALEQLQYCLNPLLGIENTEPLIVNLGADTSMCPNDSITLFAGLYSTYLWSTGDSTATLIVTSAGVYQLTITDSLGNTATDSIRVTINPTYATHDTVSICQGDSILIYGTYKKSSGIYSESLQTVNGCDSILTTTLIVNPVSSSSETFQICQGDSLLIYGTYQNSAGQYLNSLQTVNGCDSILTTTLIVNSVYSSNETFQICQGDSILVYGTYEKSSGIYSDSLQTVNGCDSVLTTTLTVSSSLSSSETTHVCQGDSILIYGAYQNLAGQYLDTLQTLSGCDSILTTTLIVNSASSSNDTLSICQGDSILIYGAYQRLSGQYLDTLQTINGCDSVLTTTLTVSSSLTSSENLQICQGDSILIYGVYQRLAGQYLDTLQTVSGCVIYSTTTLTVNFSLASNETFQICQGDSILIYGAYQNSAGQYLDTLQTINGCDSILTTTLIVNPSLASNETLHVCQGDSILVYGAYQNSAGQYLDTLQTINGCDSILTTTLIVNPTFSSSQYDTICEGNSLSIYGTLQNSSGTYINNLQTVNGCDSILSTMLYIRQQPTVSIADFTADTICINSNPINLPAGSPTGGTFLGTGIENDSFDPTIAGEGTHLVIYSFSDNNNCTNIDTAKITVQVCTSIITNVKKSFDIFIYPNPNTGRFTIELPINLNKEVHLKLLDANAKTVLEKVINKGILKANVDIEKYSNGIYFIHITIDGEVVIKKIVKG